MVKFNKNWLHKAITITWLDHWELYTNEAVTQKEVIKDLSPQKMNATGILVAYNKDMVAIASNVSNEGYDGAIFNIMRCAIDSVEVFDKEV